jgi:hypothetical protein
MPANLTPQYHKAEQAYKDAKTAEEKIAALEEMLAVIPKHKGTDHLQGDLKRKLSKLRQEETVRAKSKKSGFDPFRVEKQGAGQVVVLGPPNCGKSSIVASTTKAQTQVTEFPFATQAPVPGMMLYEDAQVQLVDLPPITKDYLPGSMLSLIRAADAALLVCDLGSKRVLEETEEILALLLEGRVHLHDPQLPSQPPAEEEPPRNIQVPALLVATKVDLADAEEVLGLVGELFEGRFRPFALSSVTRAGYDELPRRVWELLGRIRVYSKEPGKPIDRSSPFVLKQGETVLDLAGRIHRDFPEHLRQARVWGSSRFEGQAVQKDYVLAEGDVVELHVDL